MNKTVGQTAQKRKIPKFLIALVIALAFVIFGVFAFLGIYNSYIDQTLYAERLSQMREVTTQLFSGLEDVVKNQWRIVDEQCRRLIAGQPQTADELIDLMADNANLGNFEYYKSSIIAVDENGMYYTENGRQGLLSERENLSSKPERISYVSNSLTYNETRMVFLIRLDNPPVIKDDNQTVKITYFGIFQSMDELNPYFECTAYDGHNSVYVVDNNGLKLFSNGSDNLLKGYNVFSALEKLNYLHGSSLEEARKELSEHNVAYSNAVIDDTEVYYSLYQMDNAAWSLIFLIPSQYVAMNTVELVNTTIRFVLIFAAVLITMSVAIVVLLMRIQQKNALDMERKTNESLEKLNTQLSNASKAKSEFLSNMSHDIRTPMNAIVGMTKLIEHDKRDPDKLDIYLEKIQTSSQHLLSLINDVLDMSKIESGEVALNTDSVSLAEEVAQVENIIRPQAEERGQSFTIRVHELVHEHIVCDAVRLRQVVINLLSNAVKYTQNGGNIVYDIEEIHSDADDSARIKFTVTDNGYGMSSEFVEHIFEPFVRAENSTTNKVQGTGLGMAITKSIVDLMGGTIIIHSELNKGSRFEVTVDFPIDFDSDCDADVNCILLVSDDEMFVRNMKTVFKKRKAHFIAAENILEAAEATANHDVDAILLNGFIHEPTLGDTVRMLRESTQDKALIFCCDYAKPEHELGNLKKNGVDDLITRPFFYSKFARAVSGKRSGTSQPEAENAGVLNGMSFLCAEDNELNAEILSALLEMVGATCVIYPDGEEIVNAFADVEPGDYDAILMDVQMPKMNGYKATQAIRNSANPLGKTIPIIAMTANAFSSDVKDCLDAGMDAHIAKPLEISILEKTVKSLAITPTKRKNQKPSNSISV